MGRERPPATVPSLQPTSEKLLYPYPPLVLREFLLGQVSLGTVGRRGPWGHSLQPRLKDVEPLGLHQGRDNRRKGEHKLNTSSLLHKR